MSNTMLITAAQSLVKWEVVVPEVSQGMWSLMGSLVTIAEHSWVKVEVLVADM